jgi:outer membrane protein assembly factor BamB
MSLDMVFVHAMIRSLTLLAFAATALADTNWNQFRGPRGDGTSDSTGVPVTFSETENVKWKTPIHGKAWSSPVIWGSQIWLTTANEQGTELGVVCVDKNSGKILRDQTLFRVAEPQFCHKFNSYASPTPVIQEGRIFVSFGSPRIACLDTATGKVLWERRDFVCNHFRGAGSSPVVWENLMLLHFDGSDKQYVAALDTSTGKTVWQVDRSVDYQDLQPDGKPEADGDWRKAFSTPHVAVVDGKPIMFSSGAKAHYAYEPRTGKEIWRYEDRGSHSAATRPLVGDGLVFIETGFGKASVVALKLGGSGVLGEKDVAWKITKAVPNKPSAILAGDLLFVINDGGLASCIEAKTGVVVWTNRIGGNYSAALLLAEGRIYACSEEGKVTAFAPERQYRLLGESKLDSGFMASPAVSEKALYLRTKTDLYRIEK